MFRKSNFWGGILVVLLALVGCQSERLVDDGSSQGQLFTLTASKGVMSRTHLSSDGKQTLWSEGDQIYVSSADGTVNGVLTLSKDDANKKSGTFGGLVTGDPDQLVYAVFPVPADGKIDLSQITGGDKLDAPMVGQIDAENQNVNFENTCGLLRLNLQNAGGKDFTISAKNGEKQVKFLTTATVKVDNDGVAGLVYSASDEGTIALKNAVGGFMYIPYYIGEDVNVYVDNLEIAAVEAANFMGKLKQKDVKTLTYSETTAGLIEPAKVEIKNENVEGETLKLDLSSVTPDAGEGDGEATPESHEFVNIPSITEALTGGEEGAEVAITEVVVELPKIEETSDATKSVVSFEEIPQGVTVTIQEVETEDKSIEDLTVILPSTATEDEAKEAIEINMPNTTVTVKSTDGNTLYIKKMSAETFDETLVLDKNVEITSLTILKGSVQVYGKIGELMRDANNQDAVTKVTIEVGGSVGKFVGEGFSVEDKNTPEDVKEDMKEEEDGSYTIYTAAGWKTFVSMINEGNTFEGKIIRLGADIDLNNELQVPIGVQEQVDYNQICFAGTLDGQNYGIKNLKIDNSVGRFTGLFAYIQGATFMNLRLIGGEVKSTASNMYVGAFLGYGRGVTFINCHNEGCKVVQVNGNYAGGLTGCLNRTSDGSKYSYLIACSNSAEVSGTNCPAGITGGAWGGYVTLVACVNTGEISYSGTQTGQLNIYAAGIASALGGNGWMYGCFSDCEIVLDGYNHSGLVSDLGYTGENLHYSYSANTKLPPLTFGWGGSPVNETVGHSSYNDAVDNLNRGIDMYNWTANVPCTYKFVKGDKPTLIYAEPSTDPGVGNNNFGNGGKF